MPVYLRNTNRLRHSELLTATSELTWFAGPSRLINGQLVSSSVDVYIVFEYCELGDLFHYRSVSQMHCPLPVSALPVLVQYIVARLADP